METTSELVRQWFKRVWNNGESDYIKAALCPECELIGLDAEIIRSADEFIRFHKQMNDLFGDIRVDIEHLVEDGNTFAGVVTIHATHKPTDKPIHFQSSFFGAIKDGQISKATNLVDYLSVLIQLGALPADTVAQGLSGERLLHQA